jgi:hypothetical protein
MFTYVLITMNRFAKIIYNLKLILLFLADGN